MIDAHCHILPAVDDGSKSMAMSKAMLETARSCGITHIVCSSHVHHGLEDHQKHIEAYNRLCNVAGTYNIKLALGGEVKWKAVAAIPQDQLSAFALGNSNILLLEFSFGHITSQWQNIIYTMQCSGHEVIVVHPERYLDIQRNIDLAHEIYDMGIKYMVSANFLDKSFMHQHGTIKKCAKKLFKEGLIDYVASDAHKPEGYKYYPAAIKFAEKYGYNQAEADAQLNKIFN